MNNVIELKRDDWKGYKQTVTIDGEKVEYSYLDLQQEAQRHTHLRGPEKGHLNFLPSVDNISVLKDLVKLRGITSDTLFLWLMQEMKGITENFGSDTWQDVKAGCEGEFYVDLAEIDELKELFFDAVKAEQEA